MSSLFRRGNGIYYILREQNGKRVWKSTGVRNKQDALRCMVDLQEAPTPAPEQPTLGSPPLSTLAGYRMEFLTYARSAFAPATVELYARSLGRLHGFLGEKPLSAISARDVDSFKAQRLKESSSPVSLNMEIRTLRAAFQTAVRWGLISANPWKGVSMVRIPEKQPTFLTRDEFKQLLSVVKEPWLRNLLVAGVSTGLRRGELLNLRWVDVDWANGLLQVQSSASFKTKAGKRRAVPINEVLRGLLLQKLENRVGEYIFSLGGSPIKPDFFTHKFKAAVRAACLPEKLHVHSLRHTFATWLVQGGVSIYEIQRLLGHSSITVTEVYAHLAPAQLHRAVERIGLDKEVINGTLDIGYRAAGTDHRSRTP